ncbi:Tyrosine--tRNA ligase, mitochondrial [Wickerhamiella sorbophila]|uniref:Tyrosine--tRNA ligase n=1 Tax=Wickerhamiella sorbophila TaxID=45607 RepID=A0A2T0FDZ3_9ASCO|nr:Tyrosine--tRNA ligase, mitochondrial [Wickerhamiella sorbophila]PRT53223.1 Tyrosine--tRNA ligase, mitochondrial [Wickerhamiella sorbophila]
MIIGRGRLFCQPRRFYSNADLKTPLIQALRERGLLTQVTDEKVVAAAETPTKVYLGADPSAESLHLGNLVPLTVLLHFYLRGHTAMPLVGGATGMVGDPSGRMTEREAMENAKRERNVGKIHAQMTKFLETGAKIAQKYGYSKPGSVEPVNNYSWWKDVSMLGFLSTYGRHIRVSQMLGRESVRQRLKSEAGLGFNEFTYQILQAFDFYHLYKHHQCTIQIGGNDQWGNITAGTDLISRLIPDGSAFGVTVPLLTTPSGEKFGKSAGNAVFIDGKLTKPFHMYQYLVNSPDSVVESYLKLFTLIPLDEIAEITKKHMQAPEDRVAQHRLASELTDMIHGEGSAANAQFVTAIMFENARATSAEILTAFGSQGLLNELPADEVIGKHWKNILALLTGKSKSETGRLVKQGGVYVGLDRRPLKSQFVESSDIEDGLLLIRIGKTEYYAVKLI